ncbi:hypothetical protein MKW98_030887 [Papaver atlanticum]|uniref:Uncharacterized protein n=1 Tax=Papaver atlanticum TaxID=357466 RepID=A0AAD4XRS3_9MAGN|nr:hypothetical protein MKW98_030887 [Papaver atlanticum]
MSEYSIYANYIPCSKISRQFRRSSNDSSGSSMLNFEEGPRSNLDNVRYLEGVRLCTLPNAEFYVQAWSLRPHLYSIISYK